VKENTMKRNLIAVIITLAAGAAFAEPSIQMDENRSFAAPETTSYVADTRADEVVHNLNP
jgi:hypothetical protein